MVTAYSVYGLCAEASEPIPGLVALGSASGVDLRIQAGSMPAGFDQLREAFPRLWYVSPYRDVHGEPALRVWELDNGAYLWLRYTDGIEFLVDRSGRNLWAAWPVTLTITDVASYLLGPVLGFVLRLRGIVALHASAIAGDGWAMAFVGSDSAGKSTTAAALAALGHPVMADDVLALSRAEPFIVQPGYPRLRLWRASLDALVGVAGGRAHVPATTEGRRHHLDLTRNGYRFQGDPLPLRIIYVLGERRDARPAVVSLPPAEALMSLVANTFATRLLDRAMRAHEFEMLTRLVTSVPVRRVHPHQDLARLRDLCEVILEDSAR